MSAIFPTIEPSAPRCAGHPLAGDAYLGRWTDGPITLDMWHAGGFGLSDRAELAFRITFPDHIGQTIEGRDYRPSPLHAIDSDESAGGLIGFFACYAEALAYDDGSDLPPEAVDNAELLTNYADELSMMSSDLEGVYDD